MSVWGVCMMKNEQDVAYDVLIHMASQGLAGLIVSDNLSSDDTTGEIHRAIADLSIPCVYQFDDEPAHWQSRKTTALAYEALSHGASWVVPFDADELWTAAGQTVAEFLLAQPRDVMIVQATLYNYVSTAEDDLYISSPFRRMTHRLPEPGSIPKVAARCRENLIIEEGNHGARYLTPAGTTATGLRVNHYPWRTYEQLKAKVRNGKQALEATTLSSETGSHWREWGALTDESLMRLYETRLSFKTTDELVYDPIW